MFNLSDIWTMFFMAMPGCETFCSPPNRKSLMYTLYSAFLSALLANINNRKSLSQSGSTVASSANNHGLGSNSNHGLGHGPTIQFTRNIVVCPFSRNYARSTDVWSQYDIGPHSPVKSESDNAPDGSVSRNENPKAVPYTVPD
jgi:hypothetical protein